MPRFLTVLETKIILKIIIERLAMMEQHPILQMMKKENLTTLSFSFNKESQNWDIILSKEWTKKIDWASEDPKGFTKSIKKINKEEIKEIINRHQLEKYINNLLRLVKSGRHELLEILYDSTWNLCSITALHQTSKEYTVGGIRRSLMPKTEIEVISDILNLSRSMTFRCAAANLPCAGACLGLHAPQSNPETVDALAGFLAYVSRRYHVKWGIEAGFSQVELKKISGYADQLITNKNSDLIAACSAYSIYTAIKQALEYRYPDAKIAGKSIGIEGLGKLGSQLALLLLKAGADVIVTDMNPDQIQEFVKLHTPEYGAAITAVSPGEIRMQMGHVFIPCGHSGVLTRDNIHEIKYHIVIGGANNVLLGNTISEEIDLAEKLYRYKILYIPDWIANIGAVICATEIILTSNIPVLEDVQKKIEDICTPLIKEILMQSRQQGKLPLDLAYQKFYPIIYKQDGTGIFHGNTQNDIGNY